MQAYIAVRRCLFSDDCAAQPLVEAARTQILPQDPEARARYRPRHQITCQQVHEGATHTPSVVRLKDLDRPDLTGEATFAHRIVTLTATRPESDDLACALRDIYPCRDRAGWDFENRSPHCRPAVGRQTVQHVSGE
ncbi:hypothetical protein SPHINGO391_350393 [Sphingomonas aurantiaca]|uniref:Uncharacterized protein n=1 Tax=Sphingomonas aurantiaca TaxID=185949 RepID=A0A5E7Y7I5_9SPHN|nr:hypothetical protein SPHINGO391_350393 [Sphingomonas aurantiaca]